MHLRSARHTLTAGIIAVSGLIIAFLAAALWVEKTAERDLAALVRGRGFEQHLGAILAATLDAETAGRGFAATGEESFLEPFLAAGAALPELVAALPGLADQPGVSAGDVRRFGDLAARRLAAAERVIAVRRSSGRDAALELVVHGGGQALQDEIRSAHTALVATTRRALDDRLTAVARWQHLLLGSGLAGGIIMLALLGYTRRAVNRGLGQHAQLVAAEQSARVEVDRGLERLAAAVDSGSDGFIAFDTGWHYRYVSASAAQLLGKPAQELLGRRIWDIFPDGVNRPFYHAYHRVMQGGPAEIMEEYYAPWDRWFENRIQRSPEGITVFFREITDRKRLERSLATGNRALRTSAACSDVMDLAVDEKSLLEATCRVAVERGGYRMVWIGLAADDAARTVRPVAWAGTGADYLQQIKITWDDAPSGQGPTGTAIRTAQPQTVRNISESPAFQPWREAAQRHGYASSAAVPLISGGRTLGAVSFYSAEADAFDAGELGFLADLGRKVATHLLALQARQDHARAALALADREARLRLATEGSNIGLWDWDVKDNTVYFSPIWKRQLGYAEHEITPAFEEWRTRVHPDDLPGALATLERYLAAPWPDYELELRMRHKDGSYRHILARAILLVDASGRPERMLGSHLDVTEIRLLAADLAVSRNQLHAFARRLETVREEQSARLARQVHDVLGQQLTALKLDLALLKRVAAAQPALVGKISASSQLVDESITTVQQIAAELRPSTLDKLGLGPTLAQELGTFRERTGVVGVSAIDEGPLPYDGPTTTGIYRIFQEALTNVARHAAATRVTVELLYDPAGGLTLTVTDNGRGFDATVRDTLGLIGMNERAIFLGGRLDIRSAAGLGTTVTLWVPPPNR